jgi:hypothetical protein
MRNRSGRTQMPPAVYVLMAPTRVATYHFVCESMNWHEPFGLRKQDVADAASGPRLENTVIFLQLNYAQTPLVSLKIRVRILNKLLKGGRITGLSTGNRAIGNLLGA